MARRISSNYVIFRVYCEAIMRKIVKKFNVFSFSELSQESKEKAIEAYRDQFIHSSDPVLWQDEMFDSLKALFEASDINLTDYSLGLCSHSYIKFDMDPDVSGLSGSRALAWLENNLLYQFRVTRNEYVRNRKKYFEYGYRVGKIKNCPMTGYFFDHTLLDSLHQSIVDGMCLKDAYTGLADVFVETLQTEYDYQCSDEYISEYLEMSSYEFLENGSVYDE